MLADTNTVSMMVSRGFTGGNVYLRVTHTVDEGLLGIRRHPPHAVELGGIPDCL